MKIFYKSVLALLGNAIVANAQSSMDIMAISLDMNSAFSMVNDAIDNYIAGVDPQPVCTDPVSNHVVCISVEDDIDDTAFVVHPLVPGDLTLGALKGTPDYDLGTGLVQAFIDAAMPDGCSDVGKYGLATYPWLDATDQSDITATSLVKSFTKDDGMYVCGSDPLVTEAPPMDMDDSGTDLEIPVAPTRNINGDLIPEFIWYEAPEGVDYDYFGSLEMCGGAAIKMDYSEYVQREFGSNAVFAYRQYGMSDNACGDDMAPMMRLTPGKVYKINFINTSQSDTNLHTHGLHIGGNGYSDDVVRAIPAGMCGVYIWDIIDNHASGMHWYHPHLHEWTYEQVRGRAFGPIFVDEIPEVLETYPPSVQAWLANEIFVQMSTETVPSPILEGDGVRDGRCEGGYENCYPRANNKRLVHVQMIKDEWYSLELHNIVPAGTGKDVIKFFGPDGTGDADCITMIAGYDGVYRSKVPRPVDDYPEEPNYFHCNGASRLHLAIKCQSQATMKLSKEDSSPSFYGIEDPEVPYILEIDIIEGEKTIASPYADEANLVQWEPPRPQYLEDLTTWDGEVETWDIRTAVLGLELAMAAKPPDLSITVPVFNNKVFHGATPNHYATYGAVQEWSYWGSAAAPGGHPMHVHVNHMQIYGPAGTNFTDCGPNFEYGEWVDTIRVASSEMDPCVARHRFNDYTGKVIMHCHDLFHEDAGMMGLVMIEGGPENPWGNTYEAPEVECINVL